MSNNSHSKLTGRQHVVMSCSVQVSASLQNQNLRADLRWEVKRIRKSARKSQKAVNFTHPLVNSGFHNKRLLAIVQLLLTCTGWPNGKKNLCLLMSKFELDQSQRKSTQVVASRSKSTQVGGQTKRKLNASPKLVSTSESVCVTFRKCTLFLCFSTKKKKKKKKKKKNSSGFSLASRVPANIVFLVHYSALHHLTAQHVIIRRHYEL